MNTIFLSVLEAQDKAAALLAAIDERDAAEVIRRRFEVNVDSFAAVPRSPFVYWASNRLLALFSELPGVEGPGLPT